MLRINNIAPIYGISHRVFFEFDSSSIPRVTETEEDSKCNN